MNLLSSIGNWTHDILKSSISRYLKMAIKIFITGGTIDGLEYDSATAAPKSNKSLIPGLLQQARVTSNYSVDVVMSKDSKFITHKDRELLLKNCQQCKEDWIVITHGTMTMANTAKFLGEKHLQKTIVFVGSAIPANKENSDALFNLGAALTAVQILPRGVYLTMNGKVFSWDNVRKDPDSGFFDIEKR
jgi:L-asparaginase